jgi:hypothetical protein
MPFANATPPRVSTQRQTTPSPKTPVVLPWTDGLAGGSELGRGADEAAQHPGIFDHDVGLTDISVSSHGVMGIQTPNIDERTSRASRLRTLFERLEGGELAPRNRLRDASWRLEMALQCARKHARECAPGSGAFPSYFQGANQGRFEAPFSRTLSSCALAQPFRAQHR